MKTLARLCVLVLLILSACSPVQRVLKNPRYFQEVADSVVKRGYCINDTVIVYDTLVEEFLVDSPSFIYDTVYSRSLATILYFDTILPNGTKVKIRQGILSVDCPQVKGKRVSIKTEAVVRDKRLEIILDKEITTWKHYSDSLKQVVKERDLKIREVQHDLAVANWKFYLLIAIWIGYTLFKLLKAFRII